MSDDGYGPLRTYQITWKSGHIETIQGHQVTFESSGLALTSILSPLSVEARTEPRFMVHGEFDGHWRLVLAAPETELHTIRDVTGQEAVEPRVTQ